MSRSFKEWIATLDQHYGGLNAFEDAGSVRNMRKAELEIIARHKRISAGIEDEGARAEFDETFSEEVSDAKGNVELLDKWLFERGLKP